MKYTKFNKVEDDIKPILKKNVASRVDDMTLYAAYAFTKLKDVDVSMPTTWLEQVFNNKMYRIAYGVAPFETVSRIRRKLQEKYEELRPTKEQMEEKKRLEKEYKQYARQKGGNNDK